MDIDAENAKAYRAFARGRYAEAADGASGVLRQAPDDPGALTLVGRLALISGEPDVALNVFERVLERHPRMPALWLDLTFALRDLGHHREAAGAAERALALDAENVAAWVKLGEIFLSLNERERASEAFRRALAVEPASVAACRGLCQAEDVEPNAEIAQRMEALTRSPSLRARDAAELHYALAQIARRADRREEFIRHLFTANAKQRALCSDGRAEYAAAFDRLEAAFTRGAFAKAARAERTEPIPIFVLGMPRSGTTLVEQLLAGHPDVAAGGELNYMRGPLTRAVERATGRPFPEGFEAIPGHEVTLLAQAYAHRLSVVGKGAAYVTDKTPGNFHLLGLLRTLFSDAKIVHVARDPMDTCFSILQQPFDDRSPHTCDVELLAYAYGRYARLMQRWSELFPREFITVEYERLVEAPALEGRRLYERCGLAWDDSYLEFHRANIAVRTFSAAQVRRPIYTSSIGGWRAYAAELAPLEKALRRELNRPLDPNARAQ